MGKEPSKTYNNPTQFASLLRNQEREALVFEGRFAVIDTTRKYSKVLEEHVGSMAVSSSPNLRGINYDITYRGDATRKSFLTGSRDWRTVKPEGIETPDGKSLVYIANSISDSKSTEARFYAPMDKSLTGFTPLLIDILEATRDKVLTKRVISEIASRWEEHGSKKYRYQGFLIAQTILDYQASESNFAHTLKQARGEFFRLSQLSIFDNKYVESFTRGYLNVLPAYQHEDFKRQLSLWMDVRAAMKPREERLKSERSTKKRKRR